MKKFYAIAAVAVFTLAVGSVASAQPYAPASSTPPAASDVPWFAYRHASTYEEGVLTGQARYLHGLGLYLQLREDARNRYEEARSKYYDNEKKRVSTYFEIKAINEARRAEKAPPVLTKAVIDGWVQQAQPKRLTPREYNVDSGTVQWPAALQAKEFDAERLVLNNLFERRTAGEFGTNSRFFLDVRTCTARMKDMLLKYSKSPDCWFGQQEYMGARNFLDSLANEARLAPNLEGLAAN